MDNCQERRSPFEILKGLVDAIILKKNLKALFILRCGLNNRLKPTFFGYSFPFKHEKINKSEFVRREPLTWICLVEIGQGRLTNME